MPLGLWVMIAAGIGRILLSVVELVFARLTHRPRT